MQKSTRIAELSTKVTEEGLLFTALCMQGGLVTRKLSLSICLSARLSNACIVTKRKKDMSRFLYHTKEHLAAFSQKKNGWSGTTPFTCNFRSKWPHWSEMADFQSIFVSKIGLCLKSLLQSEVTTISRNVLLRTCTLIRSLV